MSPRSLQLLRRRKGRTGQRVRGHAGAHGKRWMVWKMESVARDAGGYNFAWRRLVAGVTCSAVDDGGNGDIGARMRLFHRMAVSAFVRAVLDVVEARLRHPHGRNVDRNNSPGDLLARLPLNHGFGDLVTNDANASFEKVCGNLLRLEFRPRQRALPLLFGDHPVAQPRKAAPDLANVNDIHGYIIKGNVCIELLHGQHDIVDRTMRDLSRRDCRLEFERMAVEARLVH